jgi:hypothetical protein
MSAIVSPREFAAANRRRRRESPGGIAEYHDDAVRVGQREQRVDLYIAFRHI